MNMKIRNFSWVAAFAASCLLATVARAEVKIGVVDLKKVFESYWKRDQSEKTLKERASGFEKIRNQLMEDYKRANEDLRKLYDSANDQAIAAAEREKRKGEVEKKAADVREQENAIRQFNETSTKTLQELQGRLRDQVLKEILSVVDEKSKAAGYQIVFDTAAQTGNFTPSVLYTTLTGTEVDLTEAVLKELNANAPKDGGSDASKGDAKPAGDKK